MWINFGLSIESTQQVSSKRRRTNISMRTGILSNVLFGSLLFCFALRAFKYQDSILLQSPIHGSTSSVLVYIPGGNVPSEAYIPIVKAIQQEFATYDISLTGIIVRYPKVFNFEIIPFWNAGSMVAQAMTLLRPTSNETIFIGGHSMGAVLAQMVAYDQGSDLRFNGVLVHSAFIHKKFRRNVIPVRTLTLSGTRDGMNRITAVAEHFRELESHAQYRYLSPTIIIEGMNHMQLADYYSEFHSRRDLTATMSTELALRQTATYSAQFLLNCMGQETDLQGFFDAMSFSEERYLGPYVRAIEADLSGETCVQAQKLILGQEANEREIYSNEPILNKPSAYQSAETQPKGNSTHTRVETYASKASNYFGRASLPQAVQTLSCKMLAKEKVTDAQSDRDRCLNISKDIFDRVLASLPKEIQIEYLENPYRGFIGHDTPDQEIFRDILEFQPNQDYSDSLNGALGNIPVTKQHSGKIYCHVLSQSRAFEHIMIDAHRSLTKVVTKNEL